MTDLGTSAQERSDAVTRVLAALSTDAADGAVGQDTLRDALANEGRSLLDLPEVGLFLALTQGSLFEPVPSAVDESSDDQARIGLGQGQPIVDLTELRAEVFVDDSRLDDRLLDDLPEPTGTPAALDPPTSPSIAPSTGEHHNGPSHRRGRRFRSLRRGTGTPATPAVRPGPADPADPGGPAKLADSTGDSSDAPGERRVVTPERPARRDWPEGIPEKIESLEAHLRSVLTPALTVDGAVHPTDAGDGRPDPYLPQRFVTWRIALATLLDVATPRLGYRGEPVGTSRPDPYWPRPVERRVDELREWLDGALAAPVSLRFSTFDLPAGAGVDPYWAPTTVRHLREFEDRLRQLLQAAVVVPLVDPSVSGTSAPDEPYWRPAVVRQLDQLTTFLRSLSMAPVAPTAARRTATDNGARPDPYWPRHLVRDLPAAPHGAPRSADALEADLAAALSDVALVGDADLEPAAAEMEIALAQLLRTEPLDRIGRTHPATLAGFLVYQTGLHPTPDDFDEHVPLRALRRTNAVGLAFSEALVRLDKPVFREVEHRDTFDHRVRYLRRMQLHVGLAAADLTAVLDAVAASHQAGAASGREVATDWLIARGAVESAIGRETARLLTRTDQGELLLESLLDVVRLLPGAPGHEVERCAPGCLPERVAPTIAAWLQHAEHAVAPERWGEQARPVVRLAADPGAGPLVQLPRSKVRWHLNGELLAYGSPGTAKSLPLPLVRSGRWRLTTGTSRHRSPLDVRVTSAAPDRIVLVFDERGRLHHHSQPLGGVSATIIAPTGSRVDGVTARTVLLGAWAGHERIDVSLGDRDVVEVDQRGSTMVSLAVDPCLTTSITGTTLGTDTVVVADPTLVIRGHVPPAGEMTVTIEGNGWKRSVGLDHPSVRQVAGAYRLDRLLERVTTGVESIDVTVHRAGGTMRSRHRMTFAPALRRAGTEHGGRTLPSAAFATASALSGGGTTGSTDRNAAELDTLWTADPMSAAAHDALIAGRADARWEIGSGWRPPAAPQDVVASIAALFRPIVLVAIDPVAATGLAGFDPSTTFGPPDTIGRAGINVVGPPLSPTTWALAALADEAGLADWVAAHHRAVRQWQTTLGSIAQLAPVFDLARRTGRAGGVLPLVAAALIAASDSPKRARAATWVDEAAAVAPNLTRSAVVAAIGYRHLQRRYPESRFVTVPLGSVRLAAVGHQV